MAAAGTGGGIDTGGRTNVLSSELSASTIEAPGLRCAPHAVQNSAFPAGWPQDVQKASMAVSVGRWPRCG